MLFSQVEAHNWSIYPSWQGNELPLPQQAKAQVRIRRDDQ
jgi:hypothetical protein